MSLFSSRVTATGEIDRIPAEQGKVRLAMTKLDDDLQATKYDLYSKRINDTTFMDEVYNEGTRRFEPYSIRAFSYRVGIGMYTPEAELHIQAIRELEGGIILDGVGASGEAILSFRRARGFHTSREVVQNNDPLGEIRAYAHNGTSFTLVSYIRFTVPSTTGTLSGDILFYTKAAAGLGATIRGGWSQNGSFYVGTGAGQILTTATDGFLYIPSCNGAPTGVPTTITGVVPMVYDTNKGVLYVYSGGAWRVH